MSKKNLEQRVAYMQQWEESERGWGIRPDGGSVHIDSDDVKRYIEAYWARMPNYVPEEYERPVGDPFFVRIPLKMYKELEKRKKQGAVDESFPERQYGIRLYGSQYSDLMNQDESSQRSVQESGACKPLR